MKAKVTDDNRILIALRKGYAVTYCSKGRFRERWAPRVEVTVAHPDGREQSVARMATARLTDADFISAEDLRFQEGAGHVWHYSLTDAGRRAAADLGDMPDERMFASALKINDR
jgi:hypothetical protein